MNPDDVPPNEDTNPDDPAAQLAEANERIAQISRDLDNLQLEHTLLHKLAAAGAVDLEAAVLVARARMDGRALTEIDGCIAQLRKEKAYLFSVPTQTAGSRTTAPAKDRLAAGRTALEQAAEKAARTGGRTDLHHYLKLRRSLL